MNQEATSEGNALARTDVLLVEDDLDLAGLLAGVLSGAGCRVAIAGTQDAALVHLRTHQPPDYVLLDLGLPDGDWRPILTACHGVKVTIMSGDRHGATVARASGTGFLAKPFEIDALLALVLPNAG